MSLFLFHDSDVTFKSETIHYSSSFKTSVCWGQLRVVAYIRTWIRPRPVVTISLCLCVQCKHQLTCFCWSLIKVNLSNQQLKSWWQWASSDADIICWNYNHFNHFEIHFPRGIVAAAWLNPQFHLMSSCFPTFLCLPDKHQHWTKPGQFWSEWPCSGLKNCANFIWNYDQ